MNEKKEQPNTDDEKVDSFTGSPEQQLPDLEAENQPDSQKQQNNKKSDSDE